jgi:hypothetical protein
MAPEQARGEEAGQAADVFALGATLLYAATGEGPYGRGAPELLMVRAADGRVEAMPRTIPSPLRERLQAMLDPRAARRPSAAALVGGPDGTLLRDAVARRRRRWPVWAGAAGLAVVALLAALVVAAQETGDPGPGPTTTEGAAPCTDLPYQPCGQAEPAPGTDGRRCLTDFADYDGRAGNGCEAVADDLADDEPFPEGSEPIEGTIVPADDVDTFSMAVGDGSQLLCNGRFTVRITAPEGMTLLLEVLDEGEVLDETTSAGGVSGTVTLIEQECLFSEARTLVARVSAVGGERSGEPYQLERSGSF